MGRRRKYFSEDERLAANREKSKKYYEKRKDSINQRRRKKYARIQQKSIKATRKAQAALQKTVSKLKPPEAIWLDEVLRVYRRFVLLIESDPVAYTEKICLKFMRDQDMDELSESVDKMMHFLETICGFKNKIYTCSGVGTEWKKAVTLTEQVERTQSWLQEVELVAMEGPELVERNYKAKTFDFQKVSK